MNILVNWSIPKTGILVFVIYVILEALRLIYQRSQISTVCANAEGVPHRSLPKNARHCSDVVRKSDCCNSAKPPKSQSSKIFPRKFRCHWLSAHALPVSWESPECHRHIVIGSY